MPSKPDASGSFKATLIPTGGGLTVDRFVDLGKTPGNVGICLSGGGSRALTAGMGDLRALVHLKTADGKSLFSQARALSTVSGGSWVGVPFEFLTAGTTDDDYLNRYVDDPGRLVPTKASGHDLAETLDDLPKGNAGGAVAKKLFGPVPLALQVLLLHWIADVPGPFLWQTAVSLHVLKRYGLYKHRKDFVPTTLFSYDEKTAGEIRQNGGLKDATIHLFADQGDASRLRRPFLVCNCSMFLQEPGTKFELLAPVQATAFMAGIVGSPKGTDANGRRPGGGGVTSFAFSSNPTAVDGDRVTVDQERQLALLDIVGTSSAFFAEVLQNLFKEWRKNPEMMFQHMDEHMDDLMGWAEEHMPGHFKRRLISLFGGLAMAIMRKFSFIRGIFTRKLQKVLDEIQELIPEYKYWPVADAAPADETRPTRFGDGGNVENTGVASLLSYGDIENVVSCVNSVTPLAATALGVLDKNGKEIPGTRVQIDAQVPPLFGYQPYNEKKGYVLYEGDPSPESPPTMHNQVFESAAFPELLKEMWKVTGNTKDPAELGAPADKPQRGVDQKPAVVRQRLKVKDNPWFGVSGKGGNREVTIVWVYNNRVRDWYDRLRDDVKEILGPFDDMEDGFPHYSTASTHLTTTQVNLLSSLNAWCIANPENAQIFVDLFKDA